MDSQTKALRSHSRWLVALTALALVAAAIAVLAMREPAALAARAGVGSGEGGEPAVDGMEACSAASLLSQCVVDVLPAGQLSPPGPFSPPDDSSPPGDVSTPDDSSPPDDVSIIAMPVGLPSAGAGGLAGGTWIRTVFLAAVGLAVVVTLAGAALELRRER